MVRFAFYLANLFQIFWNHLSIAYQQIHKFGQLFEVIVVDDHRRSEFFTCILKIQFYSL